MDELRSGIEAEDYIEGEIPNLSPEQQLSKRQRVMEFIKNNKDAFNKLPRREKLVICAYLVGGGAFAFGALSMGIPTLAGMTFGTQAFGSGFGSYAFLTKLGIDSTAVGFLGLKGMAGVKIGVGTGAAISSVLARAGIKFGLDRFKQKTTKKS